eukprot:1638291-Heterocapsa_arctica.AAC.1
MSAPGRTRLPGPVGPGPVPPRLGKTLLEILADVQGRVRWPAARRAGPCEPAGRRAALSGPLPRPLGLFV